MHGEPVLAKQMQSNVAVVLCSNQKYSTEILGVDVDVVVVVVVVVFRFLLAFQSRSADTACPVSETRPL